MSRIILRVCMLLMAGPLHHTHRVQPFLCVAAMHTCGATEISCGAVQVEELKSINRDLLEQVISHCPPPESPHVPVTGGAPLRRTRTTPL